MWESVKEIYFSQKGFALALALYLNAFIIIVVAGFEIWNAYNFKSTISSKKGSVCCYYSEAGIEKAIYKLSRAEKEKMGYDPVFQENLRRLIEERSIDYINPFDNDANKIGVVDFEKGKIKVYIKCFP
ncbi:MAG: hypothetical protein QMD92_01275 [bacterium]|nr:hypothetical protein [bacterium]